MPSLQEIKSDPHFINANPATKKAIFEKWSAQDPLFTKANPATQQAIKIKFGVAEEPSGIPVARSPLDFRTSPEVTGEQTALMPATFQEQAAPLVSEYQKGLAGIAAGAASIPESLSGMVGRLQYKGVPLPVQFQPGRTEEALRTMTGAGPEDKAFMLGKGAAQIAGTAGVGPLFGAGLETTAGAKALASMPGVQKTLNALAESMRSGGFSEPDIQNALGKIGARIMGGGLTGGASSAMTGGSPEEGFGVGAALPVATKTVGYFVGKAGNILNPQKVGLLDAAGGKIDNLIAKLRSGEIIVPGSTPHAGEVAASEGSANFSRLVADLLESNLPKSAKVNDAIAEQALQNAIARARQFEQASAAGQINFPAGDSEAAFMASRAEAGNLLGQEQQSINERIAAQMEEVAKARQQQLADIQAQRAGLKTTQQTQVEQLQAQQQQRLAEVGAQQKAATEAAIGRREQRVNQLMTEQEAARNALASPIEPPAPPAELESLQRQRAALEAVRGRAGEELPKVSQMETGKPIVEKADVLAKEAQENIVNPAYQKAFASHKGKIDMTGLLDRAKREFPIDRLDLSKYPTLETKIRNYEIALRQFNAGERFSAPKLNLSLSESNDIGKAINSQINSIKGQTTGGQVNVLESNLLAVKRDLEKVVEKNTSKETKQLLGQARNIARVYKIEPYDEGIAGLMRRETAEGRERLLPEKVATEVLSKEQSASEFVRSFGKDAESVDNLRTAIQDLYRRKVVQPKGAFDPAAHKKFMDEYGDKLDILDKSGMGIRDSLEEQHYIASRLESEIGKVTGQIEGINKVQQDQLNMLKTQQEEAMKALEKSHRQALGKVKEEEGKAFSELTQAQKAEYGATQKEQLAEFNRLKKEQAAVREETGAKLSEQERAVSEKFKTQKQFLEQQRKEMSAKAQAKYASILKYPNVQNMRNAMLADPNKFKEASPFLNKEAKQRLAHDVVNDIVSKGGNLEKSFTDNAKNLAAILDETYPGDGKAIVDTLINKGKALNAIADASKEGVLRPTQPTRMRDQVMREAVEQRRKDFTPDELADINALFKDAERAKTFEDLAKQGSSFMSRAATRALEENTGSKSLLFQSLEKVTSFINQTAKRLAFIDDERIRNRMALAALNPKLMAQLLSDAKKWQETGKKISQLSRQAGTITSKAIPAMMESANQNALNQ